MMRVGEFINEIRGMLISVECSYGIADRGVVIIHTNNETVTAAVDGYIARHIKEIIGHDNTVRWYVTLQGCYVTQVCCSYDHRSLSQDYSSWLLKQHPDRDVHIQAKGVRFISQEECYRFVNTNEIPSINFHVARVPTLLNSRFRVLPYKHVIKIKGE